VAALSVPSFVTTEADAAAVAFAAGSFRMDVGTSG